MPNTSYPGPENIYRHVLDNGIIILVYENFAAQSVVIEGAIRVGAILEDRATAGLADFTAAMLLRGTAVYDFDAIYERLEGVNARLSLSGGVHTTDFSASALAEDLPLVLDLLSAAVQQPTFPPDQVERVRGEILTGLQMQANDTRAVASLAFHELLYGNHPYGRSPDGYPDSITAIDREDLVNFHAEHYGPRDLVITIVGAVKQETAVAAVAAALGGWRNERQKPLPTAAPVPLPASLQRNHVAMVKKTQSDIVLGLPAPPRKAPDYLDLSLANTILGVFGMMGRLGRKVREEQGLAYYVHSRLNGGFGPAPWYVSTGVAPDRVEQAIASIREEIRRMRDEPVPDEELADSQAYRTGSLPVRLETNRGLAANIVNMELHQLGLDYLQQFPDNLNAITSERIQAAAQKYWSTDRLAIAVAGPGDAIAPAAD